MLAKYPCRCLFLSRNRLLKKKRVKKSLARNTQKPNKYDRHHVKQFKRWLYQPRKMRKLARIYLCIIIKTTNFYVMEEIGKLCS